MKKLYLISQDENNGYDTYDSMIVCAKSEKEAKMIKPDCGPNGCPDSTWCEPKFVKVLEIGIANNAIDIGEIICASFNAS